MNFCPDCGSKREQNAGGFCSNCGHQLFGSNTPNSTESKQPLSVNSGNPSKVEEKSETKVALLWIARIALAIMMLLVFLKNR